MPRCTESEYSLDFNCSPTPCPDESCQPNCSPDSEANKYFHEVGAEMTGNQLVIRIEKDKNKKNKKKGKNWDPPCDCDVIEIKRPTSTKGPRIVNGGDNNQIVFRIHSKSHLAKKEDANYRPQAIAYKINRSETTKEDHCRKITVYPQLGGPISQEVYNDHIESCDQDIYLLRVKKKNISTDEGVKHNARNLEVELRTPKLPPKPPTPAIPEPIEEVKVEIHKYKKNKKNKIIKEDKKDDEKKRNSKNKGNISLCKLRRRERRNSKQK